MDTGSEQYGQMGGLTLDGNFLFCALVVVGCIKVQISSYQYTWVSLTLNLVSIASFFLVFGLFSIIP